MPVEDTKQSKAFWYSSIFNYKKNIGQNWHSLHDFQVDKFAQVRKGPSQTITIKPPIKEQAYSTTEWRRYKEKQIQGNIV